MGVFIEIVSEDEKNVLAIGDSKIFYRRFDSEVFNKIQKKWTVVKGTDRRTGQPKRESDDKAINDELLDWLITGWENIKHPVTGADVACTKENKLKLPSGVKTQLIEHADAENTQVEIIEAEKKTSKNTPTT